VVGVDHTAPDHLTVTTIGGQVHHVRRVVISASPHAVGRHIRFHPAPHPACERLYCRPMGRHRAIAPAMAELSGHQAAHEYERIEVFRWRDMPYIGEAASTSFAGGLLSGLGEVFNRPEKPHGRLYVASAEYSTTFTDYVEGAMAAGLAICCHCCACSAGRCWYLSPR
jgi:Flavin containing amine oxidoreductase